MFKPNIESNIICPKCGWKWIFNDMTYVNHLSEYGTPMSCPKCKNKFRVRKEDTKYTHKPSNSNIAEETKKRILSLMERVNKEGCIENTYKPISHNTQIRLENGIKTNSLVCISDGYGKYHIGKDDGCYVIYVENNVGECHLYRNCYLFPELFKELKKLPDL